jgi:hypothetical protein
MVKVRSLDSAVRHGALLAGIPLLVAGLVPLSLDPLRFIWNVGRIEPLLLPAGGLVMILVGALPGVPRVLRGLLLLLLGVGPVTFLIITDTLPMVFPGQPEELVASLQGKLFFGSILLAAFLELLAQGRKTSKFFVLLACLGWLAYLAQLVLPFSGGDLAFGAFGPESMRAVQSIEVLQRVPDIEVPALQIVIAWEAVAPLLLGLLAFFGFLFALIRLLRSPSRMLGTSFKSGWAGTLAAGFVAFYLAVPIIVLGIDAEMPGIAFFGANSLALPWGVCIAVVAGLAHFLLGFTPSVPAASFSPEAGYPPGTQTPGGPVQALQPPPTPAGMAQAPAQTPVNYPASAPVLPQQTPGFSTDPQSVKPTEPAAPRQQEVYSEEQQRDVMAQFAAAREEQEAPMVPTYPSPEEPDDTSPFVSEDRTKQYSAYSPQDFFKQAGFEKPQPHHLTPEEPPEAVYESSTKQLEMAGYKTALVDEAPEPTPEPEPGPVLEPVNETRLAPYPGYPGYYICPNQSCRGGVALNAPTCPHCGGHIDW